MIKKTLFDSCVEITKESDGYMIIDCKLGLWGVSGPDHETVMREAYHYWSQYFSDGEYDILMYK